MTHLPTNWLNANTPGAGPLTSSELERAVSTREPQPDASMCSAFLSYSREENRRLRHSAYFWLVGMSLAAAVLLVVGLKHV